MTKKEEINRMEKKNKKIIKTIIGTDIFKT